MARQEPNNDTGSSRNALIAMTIGAVLVAGLVVWALTRTVQTPATVTDTAATDRFPTATVPTPPPASTQGSVSDLSTSTAAPIATATAPLTATSTTPPPPSALRGDKSTVPRIAAEDLREKINAGQVVVIDVRDTSSYANGHIAGAMHIPLSSIQANLDTIPKGKDIVTYCT